MGRRLAARARKKPAVVVGLATLRPDAVAPGGSLSLEVAVRSICPSTQRLSIDIAVEPPDSGERRVIALAKIELEPDESETLRGSVAGTRQVGRHHIDLLVNGVAFPLGGFSVVAPKPAAGRR